MSASKGNLHERLRAVTRPLHEALEAAVAIGDRIATRDGYIWHLHQLLGLHVAIERALQGLDFSPLGFAYPLPYRSRLLANDLAALGVEEQDLGTSPLRATLGLNTILAGLGCLYVVEGSAKGARAILPEIKARLGLDGNRGAAFFAGLGPETKVLWQALMAAINAIDPASEEADRVVDAANATFRLFQAGLPSRPTDREPPDARAVASSDHRDLLGYSREDLVGSDIEFISSGIPPYVQS